VVRTKVATVVEMPAAQSSPDQTNKAKRLTPHVWAYVLLPSLESE
jgi:hypothetical protein